MKAIKKRKNIAKAPAVGPKKHRKKHCIWRFNSFKWQFIWLLGSQSFYWLLPPLPLSIFAWFCRAFDLTEICLFRLFACLSNRKKNWIARSIRVSVRCTKERTKKKYMGLRLTDLPSEKKYNKKKKIQISYIVREQKKNIRIYDEWSPIWWLTVSII